MEFVARCAVVASSVALLAVGVAVLVFEQTRSRPDPVERDTGPLASINFVGILGFVVAGLVSAFSTLGTISPPPEPTDTIARAVGILGLWMAGLLAVWGLRSIGRQMSSQAEVRADTRLVTSGAFALVRHPLYLSILLLWASGALALLSWAMALCWLVLVPLFVARSRLEERLLIQHFGSDYIAYAARVPMLLPRWPRRPTQ